MKYRSLNQYHGQFILHYFVNSILFDETLCLLLKMMNPLSQMNPVLYVELIKFPPSFSGTWEASNTVCESDSLCDPAVLVSAASSEPHIRNRRLSPGSGNCGGGGGGCISGGDQHPRQLSPEGDLIAPGPTNAYGFRREKERKGQQHKGRSLRREDQKVVSRANERRHKANQKQRWVEDSLSLLKPPPAFPVQDSPAKLQPAVSYASKVKAGAQGGALEEERPLIGVLLQNQWGLSFISEARPITEALGHHSAATPSSPQPSEAVESHDLQMDITFTGEAAKGSPDVPAAAFTAISLNTHPEVDESDGKLLLSCRHLVEAMNYHNKGEAWQLSVLLVSVCSLNFLQTKMFQFFLLRMELYL